MIYTSRTSISFNVLSFCVILRVTQYERKIGGDGLPLEIRETFHRPADNFVRKRGP